MKSIKGKGIAVVLSCIMIISLSGCDSNTETSSNSTSEIISSEVTEVTTEIETSKETEVTSDTTTESSTNEVSTIEVQTTGLLTADELIKLCELTPEDYADKDLEQFIFDFNLTSENIGKYNIKNLLAGYTPEVPGENRLDVFKCEGKKAKTENLTEDISLIAMRQFNVNATRGFIVECGATGKVYSSDYNCDFRSMSEFNTIEVTEDNIKEIIDHFNELGVFSGESGELDRDVMDAPYCEIIVHYNDGTCYRIFNNFDVIVEAYEYIASYKK